jgi:hypothetical protein
VGEEEIGGWEKEEEDEEMEKGRTGNRNKMKDKIRRIKRERRSPKKRTVMKRKRRLLPDASGLK